MSTREAGWMMPGQWVVWNGSVILELVNYVKGSECMTVTVVGKPQRFEVALADLSKS